MEYDLKGRLTKRTDPNGGSESEENLLRKGSSSRSFPNLLVSAFAESAEKSLRTPQTPGNRGEWAELRLFPLGGLEGPPSLQRGAFFLSISVAASAAYYFSAGRQRKNTHDSVGRHQLLDWRDGTNTTLVGFNRAYDLHGNPTAETHLHNTPDNEAFAHDTAQRLAGYDRGGGAFTQTWALDDLGNWTQFDNNGTVQDRTHNTANQLTAITNGPVFSYDANGNMLADGSKTYTWDALDRLTSVNGVNTVIANYFYDARNMRVLKETPDATTSFYYDDMVVAEARDENNSGALLFSYIHGKQYMHELIMQSTSATALGQFYLHSHLWNVHALVDTTGTVVERYKYEAYGKRSVFDAAFTPRPVSLYTQRFGRTGHYLDPETGMYYYGYRYYNPDLGRWISRDPIEEGDGWNLYAIVGGRPVLSLDTQGLGTIEIIIDLISPILPICASHSDRNKRDWRDCSISCTNCDGTSFPVGGTEVWKKFQICKPFFPSSPAGHWVDAPGALWVLEFSCNASCPDGTTPVIWNLQPL